MVEPLGLDRWTIYLEVGPGSEEGETASCEALPEYKVATLRFDPDRLRTGDELGEFVAHELAHLPTWALFQLAEDYANQIASMAPEYMREALREKMLAETSRTGEDVTTQVGYTFIRLLRRMWAWEERAKVAEAEMRALRKRLKTLEGDK